MTGAWEEPEDRLIGSMAGHYRLVRRLGEGGMGAVYLGEREEDFTHRAAVKLLLQGSADDETMHRFRAERETLAALRHSSIVRLIDAGVTAAGIPYLAMDYVEGAALDRYCAAHALDVPSRLRLIVQLLEAIGVAHRHLVVHCDLKYANVLVTEGGLLQVLDFGIAKLLNPSQFGFVNALTKAFRPLTPEFASPEQLNGQPLTTSVDLYSTGVLLYGLLTGEHPFEDRVLQPVSLLEAICFETPEAPSRSAARLKNPPVSAKLLEGDLDAIVLKALAKEPARRYRDAEAFAADLGRYLEGMPVEAQPGSLGYRAMKFARRNRGIAAAAAVAVLAVGIGTTGTIVEGIRASRQRARAQARFKDVRQLSNAILVDFYDKVGKLPGATAAQQMLVSRAVQYLDSLASESGSDPALALELAEGFIKLAGLQGSPYENNIGQPAESLATIGKAIAIASAPARDLTRDHHAFLVLSKARMMRGDVLIGMGRVQDALAESRQAAEVLDRLVTARPRDLEVLLQAASCHEGVADMAGSVGIPSGIDRGVSRRELERSLELYRRATEVDSTSIRPRRAAVVIRMKLADVGWDADPLGSLAGYQEAYRALMDLPPRELESLPNRRLRASILRRLGESFGELGRYDDAVPVLEQNEQVLDSMLSIDPTNERARWDLAVAVNARGNVEVQRGRPREALPLYERVLTLLDQSTNLAQSVQLQLTQGETFVAIGGIVDSKEKTARGLAILKELAAREQGSAQALARIGGTFLEAKPAALQDPRFALECIEKAIASAGGSADPSTLLLKARALRQLGRQADAVSAAQAALAQLPPAESAQPGISIRKRIEDFLRR